MGLLGDLTGVNEIADLAKTVVNKIWPDKTEEEKARIALEMQGIMNDYNLKSAQIEVNKAEASSSSWFAQDWRPYIGWIAGSGLLYQYIIHPFLVWVSVNFHIIPPPELDISTLYQLLLAMLGIGVMHTVENVKKG